MTARLLALLPLLAFAAAPAAATTTVTAAAVAADLEILERALEELHPGLLRYNEPGELERRFAELEDELEEEMSLASAYLALAELVATIRCGHTYLNFWNQSEAVRSELFDDSDKVPFTFRLTGDRLLVTASAADEPRVVPGTAIRAIDGVEVGDIVERLLPLIHADGTSDHARRFDLNVTGVGRYENFDVYFPLLYPPTGGRYRFDAVDAATGEPFSFEAAALSRETRRARLAERYGAQPQSPDDLWEFRLLDAATGYLRPGSFVTWKMELDWRRFLDDTFATLRSEEIGTLIVDVRGNSGGDDDVLAALLDHLLPEPVELPEMRELMRYRKVPTDLEPFLDTWDRAFMDLGSSVEPTGDGFYTRSAGTTSPKRLGGSAEAYRGRVFLLVDPANSSATFTLARVLEESGRATLVGLPTGGNQRGINGGQVFFLRLPNTGLEVDIPVIGYFPAGEPPDDGIAPDVFTEPTAADIARGLDSALDTARRLARGEAQ